MYYICAAGFYSASGSASSCSKCAFNQPPANPATDVLAAQTRSYLCDDLLLPPAAAPSWARSSVATIWNNEKRGTRSSSSHHRIANAASERAVLMDLFAATNGAGWKNATQWGSVLPVEYWHGVVVDGSGSVAGLYLNANALSGTLPSSLGDLISLQVLSLTGNKLLGGIPSSVGQLVSLQQLWLDANSLSGSIPTEIVGMTSLQGLYLSSNRLMGTLPTDIGTMASLEVLYVDTNALSGTIPSSLEALAQTRVNADGITGIRLQLNTNAFTGTLPSSFCSSPYRLLVFTFSNSFSCYEPCESLGNDVSYIDYVGGSEYGTCGGQYELLCALNEALGINEYLSGPVGGVRQMQDNDVTFPESPLSAGEPDGNGGFVLQTISGGVESAIVRYEVAFSQDALIGYGLNHQFVVVLVCSSTTDCEGPFLLGDLPGGFVSTLPGLTGNPALIHTNPTIVFIVQRIVASGSFSQLSYSVKRFVRPTLWNCGAHFVNATGKNPCLWAGSLYSLFCLQCYFGSMLCH